MSEPVHAFDFLKQKSLDDLPRVIAIFGDDRFLKRQVLDKLLPPDDSDDCLEFAGGELEWRDIRDDLSTGSLFSQGDRRILVSDADRFATKHRDALEDYIANPSNAAVLILDFTTLASNTRLYKAIAKTDGLISCRLPEVKRGKSKSLDIARLHKWAGHWASSHHRIKLTSEAVEELTDLVGWELGLLDREMAKLALFVEEGGTVDVALVDEVVGGWKAKTTWDMLDAATEGKTADALEQLDHLLQSGDAPHALFGSVAWSLRRFATATRIYQRMEQQSGRRANLAMALEQAGFRKWPADALKKAEAQLIQISRPRATQLYRWLLETDLALKGSHSRPERARLALETLIFRLSRQARG